MTATGADATWVGIGGLDTDDLIQAGTMVTVTSDGNVSYEAWIEMLPDSARMIPLSVTAGDSRSPPPPPSHAPLSFVA